MRIIRAGGLGTVQDLGWSGYRSIGLPPGGAADRTALRIGNALAGNPDGLAGFEIALGEMEVEFESDRVFAATGAVGTLHLDGSAVPSWTTVAARSGQRCRLAPDRHGRFAYLAIGGGVDVPRTLGSRATYLPGGLGGYRGRRLAPGDHLPLGPAGDTVRPGTTRQASTAVGAIRVTAGPQERFFAEQAFETIAAAPYRLSPMSDRMGSRLAGTPVRAKRSASLPSEGTAVGAIQVPDDGQPIVILADGPTVGGYLKIGVVITADLDRFAQIPLGGEVSFVWVALAEAQRASRQASGNLARLLSEIRTTAP